MKRFLHQSFVTAIALVAVAGVCQAAGPGGVRSFSKAAATPAPSRIGSITKQPAVQKPNPGGPVSLNPQPLPPRYAQTYRPSDLMVQPSHYGNPIGVGSAARPPIYVK